MHSASLPTKEQLIALRQEALRTQSQEWLCQKQGEIAEKLRALALDPNCNNVVFRYTDQDTPFIAKYNGQLIASLKALGFHAILISINGVLAGFDIFPGLPEQLNSDFPMDSTSEKQDECAEDSTCPDGQGSSDTSKFGPQYLKDIKQRALIQKQEREAREEAIGWTADDESWLKQSQKIIVEEFKKEANNTLETKQKFGTIIYGGTQLRNGKLVEWMRSQGFWDVSMEPSRFSNGLDGQMYLTCRV